MGPLQLIILINLFVFIGLSLWAHFKRENKIRNINFFSALCGEFLLVNEVFPFLGENNLLISISYLSFSIGIYGYTFIIQHERPSKKPMNQKLVEKIPDKPVSSFSDDSIQKAHQLLDEEQS